MQGDGISQVQAVQRLIYRGRFSEALVTLQRHASANSPTRTTVLQQCLLADTLQRTGQNDEAEVVALQTLKNSSKWAELGARCHFVLGNVFRERDDTSRAISHFQTAERMAVGDLELSCWIQLRLIAALGDLGGAHSVIARLGEAKRTLTRLGDPRPFAALHLWIAEIETTSGNLDGARRHLRIADSLLAEIDDVWLRGYLAINSSGVSYHCAEISDARKWADIAVTCSEISGHRASRRAAYANLGQIEFALGNLPSAESHFRLALTHCDHRSAKYTAILDSIAQARLHSGDLSGCRSILDSLDNISSTSEPSDLNYYRAWTFQTRIQLLLREGRAVEARRLCDEIPSVSQAPRSRVGVVLQLAIIESLIANHELMAAAQNLGSVMSSSIELAPDLLAEMERIIAKALTNCGSSELASVHSQRAIETFELIGHAIGKQIAVVDAVGFSGVSAESKTEAVAARSLDRFRALFDTRRRPELFAREAAALLQDLSCAKDIELTCRTKSGQCDIPRSEFTSSAVRISFGTICDKEIVLSYVCKPDPSSIVTSLSFQRVVEGLLENKRTESEFVDSETLWSSDEWLSNQEVVCAAESMRTILHTIRKVSPTTLNVLLTGETGTGKEVLAKAIHQHSTRVTKPFIALNCAAVPRELLESQLFGYRRGAFSGANESFQGVIRAANGGTLLLDEIGEIPLEIQPKLLRFLESGEIHPLGEVHPTKIDVRLLFATNANLAEAVKQGRFREDLFFRINVIPIRIPPLRERREEIPLLVNLFAHRFSREMSREPAKFAPETMESLILYSWPGNVRQLGNEVRRLVAMTDEGSTIRPHDLSPEISKSGSAFPTCLAPSQDREPIVLSREQSLSEAVVQLERSMISYALAKTSGQVRSAAQMLGLSRKGLYLKRQRLGLMTSSTQVSVLEQAPPSDRP